MSLLDTGRNMFKIPELKKRIIFTLIIIFIYRLGGHVPSPGVNPEVLRNFIASSGGEGLFGLYDLFVG